MAKKLNCWEYMKCGKEEHRGNSKTSEVCPASTNCKELGQLQGIHDGIYGGRCCWIITGTICHDEIQGTFAEKYAECFKCKFYELVKHEEGINFKLSHALISLINKDADVEIW